MTRSVAAAIAALCVLAGAHAQCVCPAIYAPVCDLASGVTYSNDCAAACEGIEDFVKGECAPAPEMEPAPEMDGFSCVLTGGELVPDGWSGNDTGSNFCNSCFCNGDVLGCTLMLCDPAERPPCACPMIYDPVCSFGVQFSNECEALCEGVESFVPGECAAPAPGPECACPFIFDPVCTPDGVQYSNGCLADCDGVSEYSAGECAAAEPRSVCVCPAIYSPVCTPDGVQYSNECEALCGGAEDYADGECTPPEATCELGDGTSVESGYAGPGAGADWCNQCVCNDGTAGAPQSLRSRRPPPRRGARGRTFH